jgi:hypothetical protein
MRGCDGGGGDPGQTRVGVDEARIERYGCVETITCEVYPSECCGDARWWGRVGFVRWVGMETEREEAVGVVDEAGEKTEDEGVSLMAKLDQVQVAMVELTLS